MIGTKLIYSQGLYSLFDGENPISFGGKIGFESIFVLVKQLADSGLALGEGGIVQSIEAVQEFRTAQKARLDSQTRARFQKNKQAQISYYKAQNDQRDLTKRSKLYFNQPERKHKKLRYY